MSLPARSAVAVQDTWNLTPLYTAVADWQRDLGSAEARIPQIAALQGSLSRSATSLETALRSYLDTSRLIEKIYTYAHLLSDQDTADATYLGYLDTARNLYTRFSAASSYITPELLAIDTHVLEGFLAEEKLADLRRMVREIVRYKPHTLSPAEENLLALGSEVLSSSERIFSQLNNADLEFGTVEVEGTEKPLTHGSFMLLLQHPNRDVRRNAYERYYSVFRSHKNTIAATLGASIKRDSYLAKVRNFPSALSGALYGDAVAPAVYDNLIEVVSKNLGALHRYYALRRRVLKLEKLEIYDTYVPLIPDVKTTIPYPKAVEHVVAALKPLGSEYTETLRRGLSAERWVDIYENRGKRSGAYSSGCYDSPPYILMNYKEDHLHDLFTLAHEAGHSMHSFFSCKHQAFQDHSYTIFVAEVASTFNEQLIMRHLREVYRDDRKMLAYLINQQIDDIKATLFRQTMFAEFEKIAHAIIEQNEPLTIDSFRKIYASLLIKYFGTDVAFHPDSDLECLRIPHFYSAFYVYKYATGISAAITLADKVINGGSDDLSRYLSFLKAGCSKHPLELLKDAGVDMTTPEPIQTSLTLFGSLVHELEKLLA